VHEVDAFTVIYSMTNELRNIILKVITHTFICHFIHALGLFAFSGEKIEAIPVTTAVFLVVRI